MISEKICQKWKMSWNSSTAMNNFMRRCQTHDEVNVSSIDNFCLFINENVDDFFRCDTCYRNYSHNHTNMLFIILVCILRRHHTNMSFTILVCILKMSSQASAWHLPVWRCFPSTCQYDEGFIRLDSINIMA